jgi:Mn2+/Fe2+ NRAMP family transporter
MLWTLLLLIPVIYVNQEMVLRLGAVTGVGHARLILERYGKFWGAFSVIDLFVLNALTIVTEFIGISLGLTYLGLPKVPGVFAAALIVIASVSTGSFRRFERVSMVLVAGSLTLIPIFIAVHPPAGQLLHDFVVPGMPGGSELSTVMLLIIAIVGTTVAPWQLFFQQSYLIDKRITPRFIRYERVDLWIGILIVVGGAGAMMAFSAAAFGGTPGEGNFTDALGIAQGLGAAAGKWAGVLFAIALIDASIIGAAAVGLSTSYALGDVLGLRHSLHRRPSEAKGFYAVFAGLLVLSAVIVVIPGSPLGLLTEGVQTLAGVLLPSATVFLLLLCNDRGVLGPWTNGRGKNIFSGLIIAVLVMLSTILTASVLFPGINSAQIITIFAVGAALTLLAGAYLGWTAHRSKSKAAKLSVDPADPAVPELDRATWRMPPIALMTKPVMSAGSRTGLTVLRGYLLVASALVVVKVVQLAMGS